MEEKEIWVPVKGFEGKYEVSNLGRVKSLEKKMMGINISHWWKTKEIKFDKEMTFKEKILKPGMDNFGYLHYRLTSGHQNFKLFKAHRLVAAHFLPDYSEKLLVTHINKNRFDNRASNLKMITKKEMLDNHAPYSKNLRCINTGEIISKFGVWCRKNNVKHSKYYLTKHLMGIDEYYCGTKYKFEKVNDGALT